MVDKETCVFIVNIQPLGATKWSLTMLAVVWKVHNDQHQITVAPLPWWVLSLPRGVESTVFDLMARRSIKKKDKFKYSHGFSFTLIIL